MKSLVLIVTGVNNVEKVNVERKIEEQGTCFLTDLNATVEIPEGSRALELYFMDTRRELMLFPGKTEMLFADDIEKRTKLEVIEETITEIIEEEVSETCFKHKKTIVKTFVGRKEFI